MLIYLMLKFNSNKRIDLDKFEFGWITQAWDGNYTGKLTFRFAVGYRFWVAIFTWEMQIWNPSGNN